MVKLSGYGAYSAVLYFLFVVYKFIDTAASGQIDTDKIKWVSTDIGNLAGTCALAFTIHTRKRHLTDSDEFNRSIRPPLGHCRADTRCANFQPDVDLSCLLTSRNGVRGESAAKISGKIKPDDGTSAEKIATRDSWRREWSVHEINPAAGRGLG